MNTGTGRHLDKYRYLMYSMATVSVSVWIRASYWNEYQYRYRYRYRYRIPVLMLTPETECSVNVNPRLCWRS